MKRTSLSDQYWASEAAAALQRILQREHPAVFIYSGVTHTIPARIVVRADEELDVPNHFRDWDVSFEVRNGNSKG